MKTFEKTAKFLFIAGTVVLGLGVASMLVFSVGVAVYHSFPHH